MRDIDHDAEPVHLGDGLPAEFAEAAMQKVVFGFAGMGIGKFIVPVMRERHVAPAAVMEFLDPREVEADRISVFDTDHGNFATACGDLADIVRTQYDSEPAGRNFLGEAVYRVELVDGVGVCRHIAFLVERALTRINDEPHHVEPACFDLRQGDLGVEVAGVIVVQGEIVGIDIDMGIERDDPFVDFPGAFDQLLFGFRYGLWRGRARYVRRTAVAAAGKGQQQRAEQEESGLM